MTSDSRVNLNFDGSPTTVKSLVGFVGQGLEVGTRLGSTGTKMRVSVSLLDPGKVFVILYQL
jgi:hypothetical protein